MFSDLYNTDILSLASTLENGRLDEPHGSSRKVSKLCGSWLEIDLYVKDGKVTDMALRLEACALGQATLRTFYVSPISWACVETWMQSNDNSSEAILRADVGPKLWGTD